MMDTVAFLCRKAAEFRALAERDPEIAYELRRLADLLEQEADALARQPDVCR